MISISFDNTFARQLPGFYAAAQPAQVPAPRLIRFNHALMAGTPDVTGQAGRGYAWLFGWVGKGRGR